MLKLIIFDAGKVFVHTDWEKMTQDLAEYLGTSKRNLDGLFKRHTIEFQTGKMKQIDFYARYFPRHSPKKALQKDLENYSKHSRLDNKIIELVEGLHAKYRVICFTNTEQEIGRHLEKKGVFNSFDKTYYSDRIGLKKPDKEAFLHILKMEKVESHETLIIDDDKRNIIAAKRLGLKTIQFQNLEHLKMELIRMKIMEHSAGGIIVNGDKVLLSVSMKKKPFKAITFPKGHVDADEEVLEAAYREIHEETGLEMSDMALIKDLGSYYRLDGVSGNPKEISMFLFVARNINPKPLDKENPSAFWVKKKDVLKTLTIKEDKEFWSKWQSKL